MITETGYIVGKTFSGDNYKGDHPRPKTGESYSDYHDRVNEAVLNGFHKGDLSWPDWQTYCMGSGQYDGFDSSTIIK